MNDMRCLGALMFLLCLLISCDRQRDVEVRVVARDARGNAVACGQELLLDPDVSMSLKKLRFYVHGVAFRDTRGQWISPHQPKGLSHVGDGVWLIDLDDGLCDLEFSPQTHLSMPMSLPAGREYDAMRFTLGVPESLNHLDPLKSSPHLAHTSMHWGWQAGYRFLRLDGTLKGNTPYATHLGSTRCTGEVGETVTCARSNRPEFVIKQPWFESGDVAHITLDVVALFEGVDWSAPQGCMGNAEDGDCAVILKNLALDPDTGSLDGTTSRIFLAGDATK